MVRWPLIAAAAIGLSAEPLAAQENVAESVPFRQAADATIDQVIVPGYRAFADRADETIEAMVNLCATADDTTLETARGSFLSALTAWSSVEMFRFGPVREENRYERLFFWPDRRGLGLRQVRRVLADEDPTALTVETLQGKSVAVQGLLALEYVLFGSGSEMLAGGTPDSYRCRYGAIISGAVARTAREVAEAWSADDGFAAVMRDAGPDNPLYRSHGEAVQQIVQSARDQLMLVRDLKIARPLGQSAAAAKPKLAPFWRSNAVVPTIHANLDAALEIMESGGIGALLPEESQWLSQSFAFELRQAREAIDDASADALRWDEALGEVALHQRLAYALIPLGGAVVILEERIPAALGLIAGFNALDGD